MLGGSGSQDAKLVCTQAHLRNLLGAEPGPRTALPPPVAILPPSLSRQRHSPCGAHITCNGLAFPLAGLKI